MPSYPMRFLTIYPHLHVKLVTYHFSLGNPTSSFFYSNRISSPPSSSLYVQTQNLGISFKLLFFIPLYSDLPIAPHWLTSPPPSLPFSLLSEQKLNLKGPRRHTPIRFTHFSTRPFFFFFFFFQPSVLVVKMMR